MRSISFRGVFPATRAVVFAGFFILLVISSTAIGVPIVLHNTGLTTAGTPASAGAVDSNYAMISSSNPDYPGPAVIEFDLPGGYQPDSSTAQWIGPVADGSSITGDRGQGTIIYSTSFDLTGMNPATASITGHWITDDNGLTILINGQNSGNAPTTVEQIAPFSITSGFQPGINTLDFVVFNTGGATGLFVEMSGSATPEPASLSLLGFGVMGLLARRRRN